MIDRQDDEDRESLSSSSTRDEGIEEDLSFGSRRASRKSR